MKPIYQMGWKEDPGNWRPVSLTSVPRKFMEQIILSNITQHIEYNQGKTPSLHRFMKGTSCLTQFISFCGEVTLLMDVGKAVDVAYMNFSKAFATACHNILLEKLESLCLNGCVLCWVKVAGWLSPGSGGKWSYI